MAIQLLLHIGLPKTGTSSIQAFLFHNRKSLLQKGVLYPQSIKWDDGSHHRLALSMRKIKGYSEKATTEELLNNLGDEITQQSDNNLKKIILSSELFPVLFENHSFQLFLENFDFEIKVIAILRRQSHLISSHHNQIVKDPNVSETRDAINLFRTRKKQFDFLHILKQWSAHVGNNNVTALKYETNILPIFVNKILGFELIEFNRVDENINSSIHPVSAEIIRRLNKVSGLENNIRMQINRVINNSVSDLPLHTETALPLTPKQIEEIDNYYLESNKMVEKLYGISL